MEGEPPPESIASLAGRLVDEGKDFARAEVKLYRKKLAPMVGGVRNAAILAVVAIALAQAVLVALLVGLVLILSPWLGAGAATALIVIAGLAIVALIGWIAYRQLKRAFGRGSAA